MLAFREWQASYWAGERPRPVLSSIVMQAVWRRARVTANATPAFDNRHGLHGVLPGGEYVGPGRYGDCPVMVAGAIDLHGAVVIHNDGVVRGERARVLALRVLPSEDHDHCGYAYLLRPWRRRLGDVVYCDCSRGWEARHDVSLEELERELLEAYGVPRLPEGAGHWD